MVKESIDATIGSILWNFIRIRDHINYSKVVLMLTGENKEVDKKALEYLDFVIRRKYANKAIIYAPNNGIYEFANKNLKSEYEVSTKQIRLKTMDHIYKRYCLSKMFRNLFWTYIDKTDENLLGRFLRETDIDAEDVVCLAIYNLREIPEK